MAKQTNLFYKRNNPGLLDNVEQSVHTINFKILLPHSREVDAFQQNVFNTNSGITANTERGWFPF